MEVNMKGGFQVPETFRPLQKDPPCPWRATGSPERGPTQHLNPPKHEVCPTTQPLSPRHKSSFETAQSMSARTVPSTTHNTPLTSRHSSKPQIVSINDLLSTTADSFRPIYNSHSTPQPLTNPSPSRPTPTTNNASAPQPTPTTNNASAAQPLANTNSSHSTAAQPLNPSKRLAHSALRLYMNHITFTEFQRELLDILPSLSNYKSISTKIHFQFLADSPPNKPLMTDTLDPSLFSEFKKTIERSYLPQAQKATKKSKSIKTFWQRKGVCVPLVFDKMKRKTNFTKILS